LRYLFAILALCTVLSQVPNRAAARSFQAPVGELMCNPDVTTPPTTEEESSLRSVMCTFRPAEGAAEERYVGSLSAVAASNHLEQRPLLFVVRASKSKAAQPGFLQQEYFGTGPNDAGKAQLLAGDDPGVTLQLDMPGSQYWIVGKLSLKLDMALG
jgi:hypothetical protein